MASGRLSRGRVLGNARVFSSPSALPTVSAGGVPKQLSKAGVLSPSESSLSLTSQVSSASPAIHGGIGDAQDIGSKVSLTQNGQAVAGATSRLVCPICNEQMVPWTEEEDFESPQLTGL